MYSLSVITATNSW